MNQLQQLLHYRIILFLYFIISMVFLLSVPAKYIF